MANTVKLTLAFRPSAGLKKRVIQRLKDKLGAAEPMLEISIDPKIIGGAIITCNGRYQDLSVKKRLNIAASFILSIVCHQEVLKHITMIGGI